MSEQTKSYEYKVNGETFFSENRIVDGAHILRAAYAGKAIGKDPDNHGFRLYLAEDSSKSFVATDEIDLEKHSIFRAVPDSGAPFSKCR